MSLFWTWPLVLRWASSALILPPRPAEPSLPRAAPSCWFPAPQIFPARLTTAPPGLTILHSGASPLPKLCTLPAPSPSTHLPNPEQRPPPTMPRAQARPGPCSRDAPRGLPPIFPQCLANSFQQPFSYPRLSPLRPRSLTGSSTGRTGSGPLPSMLCGTAPLPSPLCPISRLPHAPETTTPSSLPAIMAAREAPGTRLRLSPPSTPPARVCARNPCGANFGLSAARRRTSKSGIW